MIASSRFGDAPFAPYEIGTWIRPTTAALIALLVVAFGLRVYGLDWDRGQYLHPDERHIVSDIMVGRISLAWPPDLDNLLDPATSTLNPRSVDPNTGQPREFAYGTLPIFVTELAAEFLGGFTATPWHDYAHAYKVGRFLSAILDTLTVLLVFLTGERLAGRRVGLLAAAIAALTPLTIQLAHFFTTDSWLTTFVTLCIYCSIRAAERGEVRWFLASGAAFGLAMASKGSVFTLAGIVGLAVVYDVWRRWNEGETFFESLTAVPERVAVAGFAAVATFALFEPYALAQPDVYRKSFTTQTQIVRGLFDVPFTRQYIGTTPVVYQAEQLVRFGMGPVAGLLALAGVPVLLWRLVRRRRAAELIVLAWLLGYGLVVSLPEAKFMRYLAPLVPVLAIAAAVAIDSVWRFLTARVDRRVGLAFGTAVLAGVALWTASFESIYARENTRLEASAWILANVPPGSTLSDEYWDDALPKGLGPGLTSEDRQLDSVTFDLYGDKVAWSDLAAYAGVLAEHPLTRPAAVAFEAGDVAAAAQMLRDAGTAAAVLPAADRAGLAATLDAAAGELHGPASELGGATRRAAGVLRDNPVLIPEVFPALGDAFLSAWQNEAGNYLYGLLEQVDYYVISSNRVLSSLPHSPWRYPVQIRFYELLQSGELGFRLVADFHRYPSIGPLSFDDDGADESWLNYDHPHVWIYEKVELASPAEYDLLMADARAQEVSPTRYPPDQLMLDEPVSAQPVVADARWSEALTGNSWGALVAWLVLLAALQAAGWPWARLVFGRFADGGWSLARVLALLVAGYLVWIGASIQVFAFRAVWCGVALALVGLAGWGLRFGWRTRRGGWVLTRSQRRVALAGELAFLAVFALFLLLRYLNPDSWHPYWGGEKPMEFAHLNATLRSAHFPPYDPWFAGGYINYYYYGLYLVAYGLKLTGIPSEIGFNLAQPTILALFAATGFGVAATFGRDLALRLVHGARTGVAVAGGLLGVLLLVGIGNLDAFLRWLDDPNAQGFTYWTWDPTRAVDGAITEFPFFTGLYADLHAHAVALPITVLAIALGYALVADGRRVALATLAWRRNLDAVLQVASRLGLLALACGTLFATNAWDVPTYLALGGGAIFMATAQVRPALTRFLIWIAACGALGVLAYGLFLPFHSHYVALFSSVARTQTPTSFWQFAAHLGGLFAIAGFGLVALLVARAGGDPPLLGQPVVPVAVVAAILLLRSLLPPDSAQIRDALTAALVIVPAITLLAAAWAAAGRGRYPARIAANAPTMLRCGLAAVAGVAFASVASDRPVLGLMFAVAAAAAMLWLVGEQAAVRYVALFVAGAAAIVGALEVVFLADDLRGGDWERMNSIFKFYNQVWTLLALAGAAFAVRMAVEAWPSLAGFAGGWFSGARVLGVTDRPIPLPSPTARTKEDAEPDALEPADVEAVRREPASARWSRAGLVVVFLTIALSLFYPALATRPRLEQRFTTDLGSGTLDGLDWMEYGVIQITPGSGGEGGLLTFGDDRAAIEWFWANVDGSPVIAEASIGPYRCNGSRFSIATGLPAVIGWDRHLRQQRYPEGIDERRRDVALLYSSPDPEVKRRILRQYGVEYVVVGPIERRGIEISGNDCVSHDVSAGIAAFAELEGTTVEVAFQQGETTIYRVLPEGQAPAGSAEPGS
jgi:YYY domain-containing protein